MIKQIFFDFDGVLAESVNVKAEAFYQLYLSFGEGVAADVLKHHLANGGMSRFEKIKHYHQSFLGVGLTETEILEWAEKFSDIVLKGVIESDEVAGAIDFLEKYRTEYNFFIITGTPTVEIKQILLERKMDHYFSGIFGSPEKKPLWSEKIIQDNHFGRNEIVFVGDALADYEAAQHSKIHFILRETNENTPLFHFYSGIRIADMNGLAAAIQKIGV